jgi:mannitol/fructose-specific phosphotransferase system IIA component (Ntr-type)
MRIKGIDFKSTDKKHVRIFFMVVAPPHDMNYLVFLGALVEFITNKDVKKMLLEIKSFEEFKNLVLGAR